MNGPEGTSGVAEPGLDDPALLAEIEAEFAELAQEIARINAMPREAVPVKAKLLEELKRQWRERIAKRGDKPEWRERLDQTLTTAIEALLEHGLQENPDGSLGFALRGDVVQTHGGKVMRALIEGFQNLLAERFPVVPPPAPAADPSAPDAPPAAAPNLLQTLMGALASAVQKVKLPEPELATSVSPGVGTTTTTGTVEIGEAGAVLQPMSASVTFSSKGAGDGAAGGPEAAAPAPDVGGAGAARPTSNAGQALVQQLIQAFGQALKPMLTGAPVKVQAVPPAPPAPVPPAGSPEGATTVATPEGAPPSPKSPQGAPTPPAPPSPPMAEAAPAPNLTQIAGGLAGLGQWLQATLQRGGGNVAVPSAPPQATSTGGAPGAPPAPDAPPAAAPKAASLNIDFAGLLQSIFKGAKVTVGQASVTPAAPTPPPSPAPQAPLAEAAVLQVERERHGPAPSAPAAEAPPVAPTAAPTTEPTKPTEPGEPKP